MKKLVLHVSAHWFNMISSDLKTEEYREITPYWVKRLFKPEFSDTFTKGDWLAYLAIFNLSQETFKKLTRQYLIVGKLSPIQFDIVDFVLGYPHEPAPEKHYYAQFWGTWYKKPRSGWAPTAFLNHYYLTIFLQDSIDNVL